MQDIILKDHVHRAERIDAHTWNITEADLVNCYLLEGDTHALLIDLGCGAGDLRSCIGSLTHKTVTFAVTHRHGDHTGGAGEFGFYYADPDDVKLVYDLMCNTPACRKMIPDNLKVNPKMGRKVKLMPLKKDMEFNLGGRTIRTEKISGHTKGSVMFIDDDAKLLFVGDAVSRELWMHLPGCTTLKEWLPGAEAVLSYMEKGYHAYGGHEDGIISIEQVKTLITLAKELVVKYENKEKIKVTRWPDEEAEIAILFDPRHIA